MFDHADEIDTLHSSTVVANIIPPSDERVARVTSNTVPTRHAIHEIAKRLDRELTELDWINVALGLFPVSGSTVTVTVDGQPIPEAVGNDRSVREHLIELLTTRRDFIHEAVKTSYSQLFNEKLRRP